jgi:hypothetical protein
MKSAEETMRSIPETYQAQSARKQRARGGVLENFILSLLSIALIVGAAMFLAGHGGSHF